MAWRDRIPGWLSWVAPLVVVLALLAYWLLAGRAVKYPPGPLAPAEPQQETLEQGDTWTRDDYLITAIATFEIEAKVLSKERYRFGREADLSPWDLALGWGAMSDQSVVDMLDIDQSGRWYHWSADEMPLPVAEIAAHSANMHILPANETALDVIEDVRVGELIGLRGSLVQVEGDDGWLWRSSLRRDDTGARSCEVVWVEEAWPIPQ